MRAMRLHHPGEPLQLDNVDEPIPGKSEVLIEVTACGVCRTDLHIIDGELPAHRLPLIPGHEIVGRVVALGQGVSTLRRGDKVGVPWLGHSCGACEYCRSERENLCDHPEFTGYDVDGGYAERVVADASYCIPLPPDSDNAHLAPLLCAGLIGFRSYRRAGEVKSLALIGFGAAAHIITQLATGDGVDVYAFTRPGDAASQQFARQLGAKWAGGTDQSPGQALDAAIIFAPAGELVPLALRLVRKGGRVVCAGIHMSDIPGFPYRDLWGEREIVSVSNLTRRDGLDVFLRINAGAVQTEVATYRLEEANRALEDLRNGKVRGAAVLIP